MSGLLRFFVLILATLYQATVSPLFPLSGAQGNVLLVVLALMAIYAGPRTAMWAIPVAAVMLGLLTDMPPGLLLLGYLPLLPLLVFFETTNVPLGNFMRTGGAVILTAAWARIVMALAAMLQGADIAPGSVLFQVLLPGLLLDVALLIVVYVPQRALRWQQASMGLSRGGYDI